MKPTHDLDADREDPATIHIKIGWECKRCAKESDCKRKHDRRTEPCEHARAK